MKHLHVFIAALCSFTTSVHAQVAGRDTAAVMIDGVDVTATYAERAITASVPQQTIDTDDMLRLGIASMADALKHLSGITVRDYGGAGGMKTISVRGLGS